jgi:hypothetical protein
MAGFIFRCPKTRRNVQGWFADDAPANEEEAYDSVKCPACNRMHFVNRLTGKTLGNDDK